MTSSEELVVVRPTEIGGVWKLQLNRPPVNALNLDMYRAATAALEGLARQEGIACVMIGSAVEGGFCAGADRNELADMTHTAFSMEGWEEREKLTLDFQQSLENFPVPTIAVMDGYAIGAGLVMASLCDLRFATTRTWFSIPELNVSRLGGAVHALRILPQATVRAMYFQGVRLDATAAAALGALNAVVEPESLWDISFEAARQISSRRPHALRLAKKALNMGQYEPIGQGDQLERLYSFRLATAERLREE